MKTTEKRGITANITINDDIVTKTVVYNNFSDELLEREEYWLRKLAKYNISPKFIAGHLSENWAVILNSMKELI